MNIYATPGQVKAQIDKTSTIDDGHLLRVLVNVSRLIDDVAGRYFYPKWQALVVDVPDSGNIWLPQPLLDVEAVDASSDSGRTYAQALTADDYWLSDGQSEQTPFQLMELDGVSAIYTGRRALRITGTWGWRRDYAGAWVDMDILTANADNGAIDPISFPLFIPIHTSIDTELNVGAVAGLDELGLSPRFEVGQLLRVDDELMAVIAVNTVTNVLTVRRGQNNTFMDSHLDGATVQVWRPEPIVVQATITQAARTFKRGLAGFEDASANAELGQVMYVKRIDPDVQLMLYEAGMRRVTI